MGAFPQGKVLLAWLVFSDGQSSKRRPVLVVYDFGDEDFLVVPVTSHLVRTASDVFVKKWKEAGLRLPSYIRVDKLSTVSKKCVERNLGRLGSEDLKKFREVLVVVCEEIVG